MFSFNRTGIALRWAFTSQNAMLTRAIYYRRGTPTHPDGDAVKRRHRPAMGVRVNESCFFHLSEKFAEFTPSSIGNWLIAGVN
jgi:hypothetical protein